MCTYNREYKHKHMCTYNRDSGMASTKSKSCPLVLSGRGAQDSAMSRDKIFWAWHRKSLPTHQYCNSKSTRKYKMLMNASTVPKDTLYAYYNYRYCIYSCTQAQKHVHIMYKIQRLSHDQLVSIMVITKNYISLFQNVRT